MKMPVLSRVSLQLPVDPPGGTSAEYLRHQAVMSLFVQHADAARPLFRVMTSVNGLEDVLILGEDAPVVTTDIAPGLWIRELATKPYAPVLHAGQQLDFAVSVNAAGVVTQPDGKKLRRDIWDIVAAGHPASDVDREAIYATWLGRQLAETATVDDARIAARGAVHVRRRPKTPSISFVRTELIGTLTIRDPLAFAAKVVDGVGRARAFGCGLLCLLPLGTNGRR